ncbi:MAG: 50S ribosomal protein L30 [Clostridia bacterium]|nr:50S ribosomal protein L30 [Clostridia bacterium]
MAETKTTKKVAAEKTTAAKKTTTTKKATTTTAAKKATATKTTTTKTTKPAEVKAAEVKSTPKTAAKAAKKSLRVTLIRSTIGCKPNQVKTVKALGLKKVNSHSDLVDNAAVRGMIFTVKHLVKVEEI